MTRKIDFTRSQERDRTIEVSKMSKVKFRYKEFLPKGAEIKVLSTKTLVDQRVDTVDVVDVDT